MLIDIASSCHVNSEDAFLAVFNGTKLNHMFCNSPFHRSMPNLVEQKLGLNLDSKELLEVLVKKHPKGMFSLIFINSLNFFPRSSESTISDSPSPSSLEEIIQELQVSMWFLFCCSKSLFVLLKKNSVSVCGRKRKLMIAFAV